MRCLQYELRSILRISVGLHLVNVSLAMLFPTRRKCTWQLNQRRNPIWNSEKISQLSHELVAVFKGLAVWSCTRRSDVSNTAPLAGDGTVVKRYAKTHAKTKPEVLDGKTCLPPPTSYYVDTDQVQQYWCRPPTIVNDTVVDGEYNEGDKITCDTDICALSSECSHLFAVMFSS